MPQSTHVTGCPALSGAPCTCEETRYLRIFFITLGICVVQVAGGIFSGSLALFSDSVHAASDGISAIISFGVARSVRLHALMQPEESVRRRFWMRISGVLLLGSLVWIGWHAVERFWNPSEVIGWAMMLVAAIGALGNVWQHKLVPHDHTETSAMQKLHVEGDLYSSIAIVFAGALIWATGWSFVDLALSAGIICFVGWRTVRAMIYGTPLHNHAQ